MKRFHLDLGIASAIVMARTGAGAELLELHKCAQAFGDGDVEKGADGAPVAFRMWRAGLNRTDHGDHYLTPEGLALLLQTQAERGNRYSIDVDHLSLSDTAPPESRKAVGWFTIEERDGDLWAVNVEWTDVVRGGFGKDVPEWRYFSPAYETKRASGEIVRLLNCALTNNPATHHVTALATSAQQKETAMYEKMTLAALLAAMDEEKDEGKKKEMEKVARAKIKAAFPEPEGEKKEATKAAEEPAEEKAAAGADAEEKKADAKDGDPDDSTAKKAAMTAELADKVLATVDRKLSEREQRAEIDRILATLPTGDRELCKDMNLDQVKRVAARLNPETLTRFAAAASASPTMGAGTSRVGMLPPSERELLDHEMGIQAKEPFVREEGTLLIFGAHATAEDAKAVQAAIASERAKGAKKDSDAFARVLSNMKGVA